MRDRRGHSTITLWFFVRMLDISQGAASGGAKFGLEQAAAFFGTTPNAMRQRLYKAKRKGFLRHVRINQKGIVTVYYVGLFRVAELMGLTDLGAPTEVESWHLKSIRDLKRVAIAAHAEMVQSHSRYKAKNNAGGNAEQVYSADDLLNTLSQNPRGSRVLYRSSRRVFIGSDVIPHGASQDGIAKQTGRSRRTIVNRLKHCDRKQVCQVAPDDEYSFFQFIDSQQIAALSMSRRYFVSGDRLFKALTNVYDTGLELKSLKRSRGLYKRYLESGKLPHSRRPLSERLSIAEKYRGEIMSWEEFNSPSHATDLCG